MFGALHMDPIRFVNTAVMGAICAYLIVKRNNFILATIVHFCNNFLTGGLSILVSIFKPDALTATTNTAAQTMDLSTTLVSGLGSTMITFAFAPVALVIGRHLIIRQKEISEGSEKKSKLGIKLVIAIILAVAMFAGGIALTIAFNPAMAQISTQV